MNALLRKDIAPRNPQNINEGNFRRLRTDRDSIIDQSTIVLCDLTKYSIQFFNPKIIAPSLLSIGIGKNLNDRSKDLFTLNFSYLKEYESSMFNKIKLITEFTNSPYRILL